MRKILIVDDEPEILDLLKDRLKANHYEVIYASDGKQGITKAKLEQPHLIIMDILMPNIDGGEAVRILKSDPKTKNIPVIFLTAVAGAQGGQNAINVEGHFFKAFAKPFKAEELLEEIKRQVG